MKKKVLLLFICVLILSSTGCLKKSNKVSNSGVNISTTTTTTQSNVNNKETKWIVDYDWTNVVDTNNTPLFADKVPMPVNMEEFLSKYESARYWQKTGVESVIINAKDLLNYTGEYYNTSIFLYDKKPESNRDSSSFNLEIKPAKDGNKYVETMADCLKNGKWKLGVHSGAFKYPTSEKDYRVNDADWMNDTLDLIVKEYGRPSYVNMILADDVTDPKSIYTSDSYGILWDCGDDLFGIWIQDFAVDESIRVFQMFNTNYITSTMKSDYVLIDFNTFISSVK